MRAKYKIWDNEKECWYEPIYEGYKGKIHDLTLTQSGELILREINGTTHESVFPDRYEVVMFTGLTDKNREMCESDLYELLLNGIETHTELVIYEIRWNDKVCGFGFFKITKDSEQPEWIGLNDKSILDKVYKGNIHQNKKLLK